MHYGTFPVLSGTPEDFARALKAKGLGTQLKVMKVGETASF
jgi:L-ascorbate metabolism protein UlaG (beta-lactamase superfamily)